MPHLTALRPRARSVRRVARGLSVLLLLGGIASADDTTRNPAEATARAWLNLAQQQACDPLLGWRPALAWAPDTTVDAPSCLISRIDVAGRGTLAFPDTGVSRQLDLARGQLDLALHAGPASARVALVFERSGPPTGYQGIQGEAYVPILQNAEGRLDLRRLGLAAALGMVDDLWVVATQEAWDLRLAGRTLGEDRGWLPRSDLGGWVSWSSPKDYVSLAVSLTTGEGANLRERNNGKDLTGLIVLRPLAGTALPSELFEVAVFGREGSRGFLTVRNHRIGGRLSLRHRWIGAGIESVFGWGLNHDPSRTPGGVSAWLRTGHDLPALGWVRVDVGADDLGTPDAGATTWRLGGGPLFPLGDAAVRPIYAAVVYEGGQLGPQARALAGAPAGQTWHLVGIKLGVRLDAGAGIRPLRGVVAPPSLREAPLDPIAQRQESAPPGPTAPATPARPTRPDDAPTPDLP